MSYAEIKKAINSDLSVPLNEIEPIGIREPVIEQTIERAELLKVKDIKVGEERNIDIFSIESSKGGKFYGFTNLTFYTTWVEPLNSELHLQVDDNDYLLANIVNNNNNTGSFYNSLIIDLFDEMHTQFVFTAANNYFRGISMVKFRNDRNYSTNILNYSHIPASLDWSNSTPGNHLQLRVNKYIPFTKKLKMYLKYGVSKIDTNASSTYNILLLNADWYAFYTLND